MGPRITRRNFLAGTAATPLALALACEPEGLRPPGVALPAGPRLSEFPFTLGVASGDPLDDRVMLWTRLALNPLAGDGGMPDERIPVGVELARDPLFHDVVLSEVTWAEPAHGHALHVDATGLNPDTWYWYRFVVEGFESRIGRTRTVPGTDTHVESLRLGIASCQKYPDGFFTAHAHLAEEDCDLIVFLGDYIYESAGSADGPRAHATAEPMDLDGYRTRYGQYRTDPDLQAAHAACPWLVLWDDHEVENNYAGLAPSESNARAHPDVDFAARRAGAYKAYWEHMPVRIPPPGADGSLTLYRSFSFGDMARFALVDTRQYRDDQVCHDDPGEACEEWGAVGQTMLGAAQETWLVDEIAGASDARWRFLVQSVVFTDLTVGGTVVNFDQWDGYPAARQRVLDAVEQVGVENFVVLSGDVHFAALSRVHKDARDARSLRLGTEIVTNSITSGGSEGDDVQQFVPVVASAIAHVEYGYGQRRGYTVLELTHTQMTVHFRIVDTVDLPTAERKTHARFFVAAGSGDITEDA